MSDSNRQEALRHHRAARKAVAEGRSPVPDLASAVRLLGAYPAERALVLLDLGVALHHEGDTAQALTMLNRAEGLARSKQAHELLMAIRHARAKIAEETGDDRAARDAWRSTADALYDDAEATMADVLKDDPDSRARRSRAVEDELERLKEEMRRRRGE